MFFFQVVLIGTSIFEYVHEEDRVELADYLGLKNLDSQVKNFNESSSIFFDSTLENFNFNGNLIFGVLELKWLKNFLFEDKLYMMDSQINHNEKTMCTIRFRSVLLKKTVSYKYSGYRVCKILLA